MSGTIVHRSIGGIAGTSEPGVRVPLRVAPATDQQHNTLRPKLVPLACWKVEDVRFEFDSSFPRPEIGQELPALGSLIDEHTVDGVKPPLSLFGHADPVGDEEYNKTLSGRRAKAVYALLTRDVEMWEKLYTQPTGGDNWHVLRAVDIMLYRVGYGASVAMVKNFQSDHGLASDGVVGPNTRKVLYKEYMDAVCPFTVEKRDFLGGGVDSGGKGDYQGCSEFNPLLVFSKSEEAAYGATVDNHARNEANAPNRRVLALLFRPGVVVTPEAWPCPRADEGCAGCRKRFFGDGDARRAPTEERRHAHETDDTFACRFYHLMTHRSPCERPGGESGEPRGDAEGNDDPEIIDIDDLEDLTREDLVSQGLIEDDGGVQDSPRVDPSTIMGALPGAKAPEKLIPIPVPGQTKKAGKLPAVSPRHAEEAPQIDEADLKDLLTGVYEWKGGYKSDKSGFADAKLDAMLREIGKFWFDGGQSPLDTTHFDGGGGFKAVDTSGSGGGDTNSKDVPVIPVWVHTMQARMFGVDQKEFKGPFKKYFQATTRLMQAYLNTWVKGLNGEVHSSVEEFFYHVGKSETNNQSGMLMGFKGAADWCGAASTFALSRGCFRYGLTFAAPAVPGIDEGAQTKYPILQTRFTQRFTKWSQKVDKKGKQINVHKPKGVDLQKNLKLNPGDIIYIVNGGRQGPLSGHVATVIKQIPGNPTSDAPGTHLDTIYMVSGNAGGAANFEGAVRVEQIEREMPPLPEDCDYEEVAGVSNKYGIAKQRIPQLTKEIAALDIAIALMVAKKSPAADIAAKKETRDKKAAELAQQEAKMAAAVKTADEKNLPLNRDDTRFKAGKHAPKDRGRSWVVSLYRTGKLDCRNKRDELIAGTDAEMQPGRRLSEMTDVAASWNPE